jgi:polyisoprenoid-binding protein YceI
MVRFLRWDHGVLRGAGLGLLLALGLAQPALADWVLDNERSAVSFVSVKNARTAELHHFKALTGTVSDAGAARIAIDLDSVETLIPIRNQRMRELLFETVRFPAARLEAQIPETMLNLEPGASVTDLVTVVLDLHGARKDFAALLVATRTAEGHMQVVLRDPLVVNAADFGLEAGIEVLREVAGLESINKAVPVSAHLVFAPSGD